MSQVTDAATPYLGTINSFIPGHMIRIQGFAPSDAQRFNINLQCGPNVNPRDDVALHLSVRLLEGYVARNTLENGGWGSEQGDGALPIAPGQRFEILLLSDSSEYKIAINGQHFATFPQKVSPSRISHLAIDGQVQLSLIAQEGGAADAAGHQAVAASSQFGHQQPSAPPPQQQQYGGYGPAQPPNQGYGYGGPVQGGGYGPPPPPPGHQPEQESGMGDIFGTASSLIAGAISSGMAEKLLGSLTSGGGHNSGAFQAAQYPHPEPPRQPDPFQLPQLGGQGGLGGLGSVGSLLSGFADQILHQPKRRIGFTLPHPNSTPSYPPYPQAARSTPLCPPSSFPAYPPAQPIHNMHLPAYATQPYPTQLQYPIQPYPGGYGANTASSKSLFGGGMLPGAAGIAGGLLPMMKGGKKMKKSKMKKAMKYGLPIAGAGVGAYALSNMVGGHGHHHYKRSSSSSSSD